MAPPGAGSGQNVFQNLEDGSFSFSCHPKVDCFNACCADLRLMLTPYDILRLKKRLNLPSHEFLEAYTETKTDDDSRFPQVLLKMTDREGRPCPLVTPQGCSVYEDRPSACRTYPLGRGSAKGGREIFFLVREDHCQGFQEDRLWTTEDWLKDQGLTEYNASNDQWMEIITSKASLGPPEHVFRKIQMFFMVSYNLDRFRAFLFQSPFLSRFDLDPGLVDRMKTSDSELLAFGFDWLKFALFGEKTLPLKS